MRIVGEWLVEADGILRPLVLARVKPTNGMEHSSRFLLDTGADRTVFCRSTLDSLGLSDLAPSTSGHLAGIGGHVSHVDFQASLLFTNDAGITITVGGVFAAFLDPAVSNSDILGRDILNLFDVIVSRPRNEVMLLAPNHRYDVTSS